MGQINARDWIFEVSPDPSIVTPVWNAVGGLESFELNPAEGEEVAETTNFASGGKAESQPMQRGASLSLEGKVIRTGSPAITPNVGQGAADALAALVGDAALGGIRFRHTLDTTWTQWNAWASKGGVGGGNNDKTSWSCTFTRSGAATTPAVV